MAALLGNAAVLHHQNTVPVTIRIEGYENIGIKGSYQMVVDLKVASDTPTEP